MRPDPVPQRRHPGPGGLPGLVVDRWDEDDAGALATNLRMLADELHESGRRVVLLSQVPVLRVGESVNLREFVSWKSRLWGASPRIPPDDADARRKEIHATMEEFTRQRPGLQLLRVDDAFYLPDGAVKYAEGRRFFYADDDHLSEAGAQHVQGRITEAIAKAVAKT